MALLTLHPDARSPCIPAPLAVRPPCSPWCPAEQGPGSWTGQPLPNRHTKPLQASQDCTYDLHPMSSATSPRTLWALADYTRYSSAFLVCRFVPQDVSGPDLCSWGRPSPLHTSVPGGLRRASPPVLYCPVSTTLSRVISSACPPLSLLCFCVCSSSRACTAVPEPYLVSVSRSTATYPLPLFVEAVQPGCVLLTWYLTSILRDTHRPSWLA